MAASALSRSDHADPYALIAAERTRLQRYLPADLAEALDEPQSGDPLLRPFVHLAAARYAIATYLPRILVHQLLEEQLQSPWLTWADGSLLFADLSGSTALAERLSTLGREGTELVTEFLNDIFDTMIQVIQRHNGDLITFGGDALLIFFNGTDHARTALQAALALQDVMHDYVTNVPNVGSFPMHLHIGVESGQVAFVSAGNLDSLHYGALGKAVNGVAAAEGLAGPGEVVIGPHARAHLRGDLDEVEVAAGYARVTALRHAAELPALTAELATPSGSPLETIPVLLNMMDRLSAYIPDVLLGRVLADPQRPQIEADLRPVTVIFAQVVGLEQLAEQLPADQAAYALQTYTATMQEAVEQFGGVVNKLDVADEGIKLVAIFGALTAYEDHPERAARAALGMRSRLAEVNRTIATLPQASAPHGQPIELRQRIGINLGIAFAGNVGSPARKEYTVMGDAVNVAARVMSKAAWGEIWCSSQAERAIAARMVCDDRGTMLVKGKSAPLRLFHLRAERDTPDVVVNDMGPLVGRERELTWLLGHLDAALAGSGHAIRIIGEAGMGKSRLTAELLEIARERGAHLIPAACFSYTASSPYAAWGEWLKALCGIISGDDDTARAAKLSERLRDLEPGMEEWLPLLGDLVRLDIPENRLTRGLDPQLRQTRRFDLIERLLHRAASQHPILALFEDLHWADPISLDLWRRVARSVAGRPILLIGLHRGTPALTPGSDAAELLELHELSSAESGVLAEHLAADLDLPAPIIQQLVGRAAGNPLFLAELLRAVADQREANPGSDANLLDNLPDSLNGLLLSRIDRLDEVSRSVLRIASVIGQRIPFGVLQSIQLADQRTLIRQLARLDSEEMTVLERVEPERVHAFRHALIQEVAYQSMLYARRRELHGRIGEYLEKRYRDDLDDYFGLLAHHYRLSDRRDKAIDYLVRAGKAAQTNYANEEAIQYYHWALEALAGDEADPRAWTIHDALGEIFEATGRYEEALSQHAQIIAAPDITPDLARRAHRKRGNIHEEQGQYALALEELDRAMTIATSGTPGISPHALPRTYADLGQVRQRLGEYDQAIEACQAGLAALRQTERDRIDELTEADLHSILGATHGMRGDYASSLRHFTHSLRAREAADDLRGLTISHNNLGYLWQLQSEYERALDQYHIVEQLASKIGLRYMLVFAHANAAYALICIGSYAEAEHRCQAALDLSREMQAQQLMAQAYNTLGIVYAQQGRYEQALVAHAEAQQLHQTLGSVYDEAEAIFNAARVYSSLARYDEAAMAATQVLERAESTQSQRLKAEGLIAYAEAHLGLGLLPQARQAAEEVRDIAATLGSKHDGGIAQRLIGQIAAQQQQPFEAAFENSIELLNTINHRFELARTWAEYGRALIGAGNYRDGNAYVKQAREAFMKIGALGELARVAQDD